MGNIHAANAGTQEFPAHTRHAVVYINTDACLRQDIGSHQARRAGTNYGDLFFSQPCHLVINNPSCMNGDTKKPGRLPGRVFRGAAEITALFPVPAMQ